MEKEQHWLKGLCCPHSIAASLYDTAEKTKRSSRVGSTHFPHCLAQQNAPVVVISLILSFPALQQSSQSAAQTMGTHREEPFQGRVWWATAFVWWWKWWDALVVVEVA